jgi:hypothetical protein
LAWPALSGTVASGVLPSQNTTTPVGVAVPDWAATEAVKVTGCPYAELPPVEDVREVVVLGSWTVSPTELLVLPEK